MEIRLGASDLSTEGPQAGVPTYSGSVRNWAVLMDPLIPTIAGPSFGVRRTTVSWKDKGVHQGSTGPQLVHGELELFFQRGFPLPKFLILILEILNLSLQIL